MHARREEVFPTRLAFFDTQVSENGRRKALPINALNFPTVFSRHRGVGKKPRPRGELVPDCLSVVPGAMVAATFREKRP
jgi:hypothetical protein